MAVAKKVKQLSVTLPDRVGLLAEVSARVAKANVNIDAICAYRSGRKAELLLVADSPTRAAKALKGLGGRVKTQEVVSVLLANRPGSLARAAGKLAKAGVNITWSWATVGTGGKSTWVLRTNNDRKAIRALSR